MAENWEAIARARGKEIEKLQLRIHRGRQRQRNLLSTIRLAVADHRKQQDELRMMRAYQAQIQRLSISLRASAKQGIVVRDGEDRLEGMAAIIQKLRERNLEQYRAISQLVAAASMVLWGFHIEPDAKGMDPDEDGREVKVTHLQELHVAFEAGQGMLTGDKSNLTKELERQQQKARGYALVVKSHALRWILELINRVGPARKRDLQAIRQKLNDLEV